ncbi:hypothetical protein FO519_007011 [Halicephalobus sp. NKZ332]|nr:hypothetical protein FO519_007011 [Halicephalobus sp. NKZ332]
MGNTGGGGKGGGGRNPICAGGVGIIPGLKVELGGRGAGWTGDLTGWGEGFGVDELLDLGVERLLLRFLHDPDVGDHGPSSDFFVFCPSSGIWTLKMDFSRVNVFSIEIAASEKKLLTK